MYDIIIVGAGTAGLTAAIYAARANKKVLVFEEKTYGGQIITSSKIENYPGLPHVSGADFAKKLYEQAIELGAEIEFEEVLKIEDLGETKKVTTDEDEYEARAVILATGSIDKKLDLKDEERLFGHGISCCATCDGSLFKGKVVAVVGGGNTAFYDALYLADLAEKVYLIHRRDGFRADDALVDKVKKKTNVEYLLNTRVTKLNGEKNLESVELTSADGSVRTLDLDGLFVAVGRAPATAKFEGLVEMDDIGYIIAGEDCLTSAPGIFAAGDLRTKSLRQLVTAASDGAIAAIAAAKY